MPATVEKFGVDADRRPYSPAVAAGASLARAAVAAAHDVGAWRPLVAVVVVAVEVVAELDGVDGALRALAADLAVVSWVALRAMVAVAA